MEDTMERFTKMLINTLGERGVGSLMANPEYAGIIDAIEEAGDRKMVEAGAQLLREESSKLRIELEGPDYLGTARWRKDQCGKRLAEHFKYPELALANIEKAVRSGRFDPEHEYGERKDSGFWGTLMFGIKKSFEPVAPAPGPNPFLNFVTGKGFCTGPGPGYGPAPQATYRDKLLMFGNSIAILESHENEALRRDEKARMVFLLTEAGVCAGRYARMVEADARSKHIPFEFERPRQPRAADQVEL
jgi:hypothetical protein